MIKAMLGIVLAENLLGMIGIVLAADRLNHNEVLVVLLIPILCTIGIVCLYIQEER